MKKAVRYKGGFSLMEMMVVLLIVSIVAAASAPMVSKKMVRSAGLNSSPWVWVGNAGSIAYNMNSAPNSTMSVGSLVDESQQHSRIYVKDDGGNNPLITLGNGTSYLKMRFKNNGLAFASDDIEPAEDSLKIGVGTEAGASSVAFGRLAKANADSSVAIGRSATTDDAANSVAIGRGARARQFGAVVIGDRGTMLNAIQGGANSVAIGRGAHVGNIARTANSAIAIGSDVQAEAERSIAVGGWARAANSVAIGGMTELGRESSISIGRGSYAWDNYSIAIGGDDELGIANLNRHAFANGNKTIAIGYGANAGTTSNAVDSAISIGNGARTTEQGAVAIGTGANASGGDGRGTQIAIGSSAQALSHGSVAMGRSARADSNAEVAIGANAHTYNWCSVAVGTDAVAGGNRTGDETNGFNFTANQGAHWTTAVGVDAQAQAVSSVAIGHDSVATGNNSTAIGKGAKAQKYSCCAFGRDANAEEESSIAIGVNSKAAGSATIAIGDTTEAYGTRSVAIGTGAKATANYQIVLGTSSHTVYIPGRLVVDSDTILSRTPYHATWVGSAWDGGYNSNSDSFKVRRLHMANDGGTTHDIRVHQEGSYAVNYDDIPLSDRRLKNVGEAFKGGLEEIKKLEVFHYTFKKDPNKTPRVGVMAQDLQKIFPDAVTKGDDGFLRIRLEDMFYALVNAVKELDSKITALAEQVKSNLGRTELLEKTVQSQQEVIEQLQLQNKELVKQNEAFEKRLAKLEKKAKKSE